MLKLGEPLQPKTSLFRGVLAELPRLYYLRRFTDTSRYTADGIFKDLFLNVRLKQFIHKPESFLRELGPLGSSLIPMEAARREVCTIRKGDKHIPAVAEDIEDVALVVRTWRLGRTKVA